MTSESGCFAGKSAARAGRERVGIFSHATGVFAIGCGGIRETDGDG
jgi:hypothetical protein